MWSKGTTKDILVTQEMPKVLRVLWLEQGTETNTFHTVLHSFTHILPWLPTFLWAASISAPRRSESALPTCLASLLLVLPIQSQDCLPLSSSLKTCPHFRASVPACPYAWKTFLPEREKTFHLSLISYCAHSIVYCLTHIPAFCFFLTFALT